MQHARRSSAAAASFALLIVAQVASAYVVPEVVVMRMKRSPEPMRSFSFSGFNPNGQMAAITGMAEYPMAFGDYGPPRAGPYYGRPSQNAYGPPAQNAYGPPTQDAYGSPSQAQDSYGPPPSGAEQPAAAEPGKQPPVLYAGVGQPESGSKPVDEKEQQNNSVEQTDNKKQHRGRDGPSSNAEASFNAWFPIMFGVFPNGGGGSGQAGNSAGSRGGQGQEQGSGGSGGSGSGFGGGFERSAGTTVIANSVSNGRHGVATSHAIAYGSPRSSQK